MFNAAANAPTSARYIELVRDIAEVDYPHWRERLNWAFRAIRDVLRAEGAPRPRRRRDRRHGRKAVAA